jgi:acyl carrier protein phosphodiesterase
MRLRLAERLHRWVDVYISPLPESLPFIEREARRLSKSKRRLVLHLEKKFDRISSHFIER